MEPERLFTDAELQLLYNTAVFETKRSATKKLYQLFSEIVEAIKDTPIHRSFDFPAGTDSLSGKISKGENYKGMPWVMLDFPKLFSHESVFAYRIMFWFGNYFSFHLVLGGTALDRFLPAFLKNLHMPQPGDVFFIKHTDPWRHEINQACDVLMQTVTAQTVHEHINQHGFIKLSAIIKETHGGRLKHEALRHYEWMLECLL